MIILTTLTDAGINSGPFDLYSNVDGYTSAFASGVSRASLLAGYSSSAAPDGTVTVRIKSNGACTNYIDVPVVTSTTTTSSTTALPIPTTTTSSTTLAPQSKVTVENFTPNATVDQILVGTDVYNKVVNAGATDFFDMPTYIGSQSLCLSVIGATVGKLYKIAASGKNSIGVIIATNGSAQSSSQGQNFTICVSLDLTNVTNLTLTLEEI